MENGDEVTYKQLAKSASGLLPEGKAKEFLTGLTSLDAGIFSKSISKYTINGQQLTGIDFGYDIGFARVGLGLGSTQYAGRNGTLDKYNSYSGRIEFNPLKGHKVGLIYYGYTPSKSMFQDNEFFSHANIALPSFKEPVSIVSATYQGNIANVVSFDAEAATSYRKGTDQTLLNGLDAVRLAWHINAEGQIPKTPLTLKGSYEHGGVGFQNSTLPLTITGTDLYKVGLKGRFFKSFLSAGIEYNHMEQNSFYSKGGNQRWGLNWQLTHDNFHQYLFPISRSKHSEPGTIQCQLHNVPFKALSGMAKLLIS